MKNRLLASMLMVLALVCVLAFSASAATQTISTAEEFLTLMNEGYTMSDTFELANNIDLTGVTGQTPIGTSGKKFEGTFNGNGYTVSGIDITSSTDTSYPFVGLFGLCQKATINDLTVEGSVTGPSNDSKDVYTGGLVAWTRGITIDNCHSYITVVNNDGGACAGGLVGYADFNGTDISVSITNSTNHGDVTAAQYTGGIIGLTQSVEKANQVLTITGCKNYGNITITAGNCVGGIVGYYRCGAATSTGSKFTLSDCANYGTVENKATATSKGGFTGGIVGAVLASGTDGKYNASITLTNLYNNGTVKRAVSASIGAIVGYLTLPVVTDGTVDVTMSDWVNSSADPDWLIYSIGDAEEAVALTMTNMVNSSTGKIFSTKLDLSQDLAINTNNTVTLDGYITAESTEAEIAAFVEANSSSYYINEGNVELLSTLTLDTEIGSPEELVLLMNVSGDADTLDMDYKLMCDIDMTGYTQGMIGSSGSGNRFTGSFDGQGYTISGLDISNNTMGTGLFAVTDGAVIKNLNVKGTVAGTGTNGSRVGGLVGVAQGNLTISNCNVDVTLTASSGASGGILGTHTATLGGTVSITGCTVKGSISGSQYMGGIFGYVVNGTKDIVIKISDCTNNASVTTTSGNVAGGIFGYFRGASTSGNNTITITGCQNTGAVTANGGEGDYAGGIVGAIGGTTANACHIGTVTISNVSNTGTISGTAATSGSVAGILRAANGTVYTLSDIHALGNLYLVGEAGVNSDETNPSTFIFANVYNPEGTRLIANNEAGLDYITQSACYHSTMGQTSITSYYNMTAESDAWVMTYDGPRLASFLGESVAVDYSIDSKADLIDLMNAPYAWGGGTFTLTKSIDISGEAQSPIGTGGNFKFMADFDGKNYTISGVKIDYDTQGAGLFGTVQYGSVKNLTVKGTVNGGDSRVGGLVGVVRAPFVIENVTVEIDVTSVNGATGGIVGLYAGYENKTLEITGCTFNGTVNGKAYNGGIIGYVLALAEQPMNLVVTDCTNNGTITGTSNGNGGIVGTTILSDGSAISVSGCTNTGSVSGYRYSGGIFAYTINNSSYGVSTNVTYTIDDCENTGAITCTDGNGSGGITGLVSIFSGSDFTVSNCINRGKVSGPQYNGGIVSYISNLEEDVCDGASYTITGCKNYGAVETTTGNVAGGILGYYTNISTGTVNNTLVIEKSANYGDITIAGGNYGAGIVGAIGGNANDVCRVDVTLSELYNASANITATNYRGGIAGVLRLANGSYTLNDLCSEGVDYALIGTLGEGTEEFTVTRAHNILGTQIVGESNGNTVTTSNALTSESPASYLVRLCGNSKWVMTLDGAKLALFTDEADVIDTSVSYTIDSAADLETVMAHSAIWSLDFVLTKSIDMTGKTQSPIGTYGGRKFTGTFDGQGYTISGIEISQGTMGAGLFGTVQGSTDDHCIIKNLTTKGSVSSTTSRAGGLVGCVAGGGVEIIDCTSNVDVSADYGAAGGIIGVVSVENGYGENITFTTLVEGCTNNGAVTGQRYNGGILGYVVGDIAGSDITITKCINNGDVTNEALNCAGGILGYYHLNQNDTTETTTETSHLTITHCGNYGDVTALETAQFIGGIIGAIPSSVAGSYTVDVVVSNVYNAGAITGKAGNTGSITGLINTLAGGSYTFDNWGDEGANNIPMLGDIGTAVKGCNSTYTVTNAYSVNGTVITSAHDGNTFNTTLALNASSSAADKAKLAMADGWLMSASGPMLAEFSTAVATNTLDASSYRYGMSAILTNELLPEYLVQLSNDVAVTDVYLTVEHFAADNSSTVEIVAPYKATAGAEVTTYRFLAPGVAAKEMNDTVEVTFFAVADGATYEAESIEKNIVDYYNMAYNVYGTETRGQAPAFMATLYSLFNYGAEAQRYFGYNTDALVNAVLPTDKVVSEFTAEASAEYEVASDCANDVYTISGFAPVLEDRVVLALSYSLTGTAADTLTFKGGYDDINGTAKTFELDGDNVVVTADTVTVYVDVVSAKDLRQMITGALYNGDTQVSDSISFSFECYATIANTAEQNICAAILNYCDAAKALFYRETVAE